MKQCQGHLQDGQIRGVIDLGGILYTCGINVTEVSDFDVFGGVSK